MGMGTSRYGPVCVRTRFIFVSVGLHIRMMQEEAAD